MSSVATQTTTGYTQSQNLRPRFISLIGGELFKLGRMWSTWIFPILIALFVIAPFIIRLPSTEIKQAIINDPIGAYKSFSGTTIIVARVFIGFFIIFAVANAIGREYQLGTIRILLSRGVGRVQLLLAKVIAVILVTLAVLAFALLVGGAMMLIFIAAKTGNLDTLSKLNSDYWNYAGMELTAALISMGATLLMATAIAAIGRSLVFALSIGLAFFPADNISTIILQLAYNITQNDFWLKISHYMLGPILNYLPATWVKGAMTLGAEPIALTREQMMKGESPITLTHALTVIAVYCVIFAVTAIVLTWKRDVKE